MSRVRTATWIHTGTDVRDCGNDVDRILTKANLDYTVDKSPIFLPTGYEIKDKVATVRKEDGVYIGVVSPTYEIYQNADAFRFISEIPNIDILKAGETPAETEERLGRQGFCVRAGLHCAPLAHQSLGTAPQGTVRVSPSLMNTSAECRAFLRAVAGRPGS